MRSLGCAVLLSLAACGGRGAVVDAGDGPGGSDGAVDSEPGACVNRGYGARPVSSLWMLDPAPAEGRTIRAAIEVTLDACDLPAIPEVAIDPAARTVTITAAVFATATACGPGERRVRPVPMRLAAGAWRVTAVGTAAAVDVVVAPAPARPCGAASGACALDCDCAGGEQCLGGTGLAGAFTTCATSCEYDRDCGGAGRCVSLDDGLDHACVPAVECDGDRPCPTGYACDGGACAPSFRLDQGTRHPCACDADCDAPLRCLTDDLGVGRCEVACPTAGPWCQGAHVCGPATADASGLARTDSVCGWLGE